MMDYRYDSELNMYKCACNGEGSCTLALIYSNSDDKDQHKYAIQILKKEKPFEADVADAAPIKKVNIWLFRGNGG